MTGRLAIPIYDEHGRLVAYCGRSVAAELPRYKFPPDSGNRLCCSTTIAPRAEATVV
jgi:hypothetical protein